MGAMAYDAVAEHKALFVADGDDAVIATALARGPWDPNALNGGPVAALMARAVEAHDPGPAGFVTRLTVELYRPVPLGRLRIEARTRRPGKRVQWIEVTIHAGDDDAVVAAGHALRVARSDEPVHDVGGRAEPPNVVMPAPPDASRATELGVTGVVGFWCANELHFAAGDWEQPGPGAAWFRLLVPVVLGEEPSGLQRVVAAADFASGVGNPVRMATTGTINAELSVHVHRPAIGQWIGVDARAWAHAEGGGLCEAVLHDAHGAVGRSAQALVIVHVLPWVRAAGEG